MLSMYVNVEHKNWHEILLYDTFAYNTAQKETPSTTPFRLLHGREVTTTLDVMTLHENNSVDTSADYITQLKKLDKWPAYVLIASRTTTQGAIIHH